MKPPETRVLIGMGKMSTVLSVVVAVYASPYSGHAHP